MYGILTNIWLIFIVNVPRPSQKCQISARLGLFLVGFSGLKYQTPWRIQVGNDRVGLASLGLGIGYCGFPGKKFTGRRYC